MNVDKRKYLFLVIALGFSGIMYLSIKQINLEKDNSYVDNSSEKNILLGSEEKEDYYLQNFYGYVRQQYQVVDVQELEKMSVNEERKTAYLTAAGSVDSLKGLEEIRLDTERIAVCRRTSFDYRG